MEKYKKYDMYTLGNIPNKPFFNKISTPNDNFTYLFFLIVFVLNFTEVLILVVVDQRKKIKDRVYEKPAVE